ncbi:GH12 family glycosyl hydrolase domain-containing protein [Nonomuraea sp. PA05]|uniref:GH12 family glycosyl hydrolase domain-containing protein n=1 Tax=Nonomuraea sp. PA05 TaxID=2604466 RepID=UPI00165294B9|nr:cellulose binding domain-containing protein [Nonomuraea sp. PA05]
MATLAALLVAAATVLTATTARAAVGCQVTYTVPNQWSGGFSANVVIKNLGDPLTGWTLGWSFAAGQQITSGWKATFTQNGGQVSAADAGWNASLGTNATTDLGFNATWNNSANPAPAAFTLNGVTCTGGTTPGEPTPTPTPTVTPPQGQLCNAFDSVTMGKYWVNNNLWGQDSGTGTQCVWAGSTSGSTISWGTSWNWSGQSNQVKSYASSVLGWHWGWKLSNTGLPTQVSANRNVSTTWNYNVSTTGTMNVAYDLWLHTISNPTWENNPTDEVMIWTYRTGGAGPVGTRQATVTLGGTNWDLYRGNIGWEVYSFVRTGNTSSVNLNLRDFLNHLVSRGWLASSKYLTSVQAGTEVFIGQGRLDTTAYSVNVS